VAAHLHSIRQRTGLTVDAVHRRGLTARSGAVHRPHEQVVAGREERDVGVYELSRSGQRGRPQAQPALAGARIDQVEHAAVVPGRVPVEVAHRKGATVR